VTTGADPEEPGPEEPAPDPVEFTSLVALLVDLTAASFRTRDEAQNGDVMGLLRQVSTDLGVVDVVPPPRGNASS
jgi:hypothetical protein